jgi:hypothetical protein
LIVVVDVVDVVVVVVVVVVLLEFICLIALEKVKRSHINHCDLMVENTYSVVQQRRNSTFRFLKVENSLLLLSLAILYSAENIFLCYKHSSLTMKNGKSLCFMKKKFEEGQKILTSQKYC